VKFQGLAAYIAEQSDRILSRWCDEASRDPDQPANRHHLTGKNLVDHLPLLLDALSRCLRNEDVGEIDQQGRQHGHQRRSVGYRVEEVLDEMHLFRRIVLVTVDDHRRERMDDSEWVAAREVILELLDRSVKASVAEYSRQTESERDLARARLEQRNVELRDANAQKDRFLTVLSHELRNPLSPILSAAQVLRRLGVQDPHFERQRAIIERQATHMSKLVNDLLDVNRIAHGKIELQPEVVDLRDSVRHAVESCRPAIISRGVALDVDLPDEPLRVFADPTRLVQVLTNLLVNAGKFTEAGGGVTVRARKDEGEAVLSVCDTGIGITPEMLPRVFDMFMQADTSLQRHGSGLGVGLVVAKSLIEMQGGRIDVRSKGLGHGAEFCIHMPLSLTVSAPVELPPPASGSATKRVVLVEDNEDSREALAAALEILGHEVLHARSAEEALDVARDERPDAFIVDIGLPGMDGCELAKNLRRLPETRRAMLIALSGYGSLADKKRAEAAGFNCHLTKPTDLEKVHALLIGDAARSGL